MELLIILKNIQDLLEEGRTWAAQSKLLNLRTVLAEDNGMDEKQYLVETQGPAVVRQ
jgi:hypothetical protein